MSAKVLTKAAAKEAKIDMIEGGRGTQAVHDVVVAMRAARRSGSANSKTKAEVDLSGSKPWRQKGTGRARAGYASSPIWRGGGVVFGPKPRDYSKKVSKTLRRLAFRKALSERIAAGEFDSPVHIHRRDELGLLADSFNQMSLGLKERDSLLADKIKIEQLFSEGKVAESDEDKPDIIIDYDVEGNIVGIEVLEASKKMVQPNGIVYEVA